MHYFLNYLLEAYIYLGIFALAYVIMQSKLTSAAVNRFVILVSMLLAVGLPLLPLTISAGNVVTETALYEVLLSPVVIGASKVNEQMMAAEQSTPWIAYLYLLGIAISLGLFLFKLGRTFNIIRLANRSTHRGCILCEVAKPNVASSFFSWVILSKQCPTEHRDWIIQHELAHIKGLHSFDLILAELMCVLFWLHPGAWYFRRVMKENHEYLADASTLRQSDDTQSYCEVLLAEAMGTSSAMLQHPFAVKAALHKRIQRIASGSKRASYRPYLMLIPIAGLALSIHACSEDKVEQPVSPEVEESLKIFNRMIEEGNMEYPEGVDPDLIIEKMRDAIRRGEVNYVIPPEGINTGQKDEDGVYTIVDVMPTFEGGDAGLMRWLGENIKYPDGAKEDGVKGTVYISFVVGIDGKVSRVKSLKKTGVDQRLADEAIATVERMPAWNPGMQEGEKVEVRYNLPIRFSLN